MNHKIILEEMYVHNGIYIVMEMIYGDNEVKMKPFRLSSLSMSYTPGNIPYLNIIMENLEYEQNTIETLTDNRLIRLEEFITEDKIEMFQKEHHIRSGCIYLFRLQDKAIIKDRLRALFNTSVSTEHLNLNKRMPYGRLKTYHNALKQLKQLDIDKYIDK